jgi:hypothetical protein
MRADPTQFLGKNNPGPGNYNLEYKNKAGISILPRRKLFYEENNVFAPAPGTYEADKRIKNHFVKIGTERRLRDDIDKDIPGPGEYNSKFHNMEKNHQPSTVFGTSDRKTVNLATGEVPGPGNYDMEKKVAEGPKYSLSGRFGDSKGKKDAKCPGPNH